MVLQWSSNKTPQTHFPTIQCHHLSIEWPNSSCYGTNSTTVRVEVHHNSLLRVLAKTLLIWQHCVEACPHKAQHWNLDLIQGRESLPFSCDLGGWRLHFLLMESCVLYCYSASNDSHALGFRRAPPPPPPPFHLSLKVVTQQNTHMHTYTMLTSNLAVLQRVAHPRLYAHTHTHTQRDAQKCERYKGLEGNKCENEKIITKTCLAVHTHGQTLSVWPARSPR